MTAPDSPLPIPPALPAAAGSPPSAGLSLWGLPLRGLPPWGRTALAVVAGGVLADVVVHGLQGGGSWLGLGALAGGWWWLARGQVAGGRPPIPTSVEGWNERCQGLLGQFSRLDSDPSALGIRAEALHTLLQDTGRQALRVALVSGDPPAAASLSAMTEALRGPRALQFLVSHPLPSGSAHWQWPDSFAACDALIYHLRPPLTAADLRWLEAVPEGLPLWVVAQTGPQRAPERWRDDLHSQWPASATRPILPWDGQPDHLAACLAPLALWLARDGARLPQATLLRGLEQLHGRWQADLERLRRGQWRQLQQRTQWLVAAGVLVTPSLSLDLLVVSVANGLMLREMARLWDCPWTLEQLREAATQVGKAALALGVVEWSTQAVAAAFKLHGATWLVGGGLQALSAAYLTRVIGRAMADVMARAAGVSEPDLAAIKAEAPLLVARAAEAERLDWGAFLQEARAWLRQQAESEPTALPNPTAGA